MHLLVQSVPLVALVVLLGSGRVAPAAACGIAALLALPAALLNLPGPAALPRFALEALAGGAWLAIVPVGFITGGLVFHACVTPARAEDRPADVTDAVFNASFLLGPFAECATGFGVGTVFAIGVLRRAGIEGVFAALTGLVAQTFIPWGGLGPGTAVGAALAGIPAQDIAARDAWQTALVILLLLPCTWYWLGRAGHPVPAARRWRQVPWVLAVGVLLVALHRVLPWEMCGLLATGAVLTARLLATRPWGGRGSLRAAAPYVALVAGLGALRLWHDAPAARPFADLPALPANHAVVAVWTVALAMLALAPHRMRLLADAARRGRRAVVALLGFVILARFLAQAGIPQALAAALAGAFGMAAPYAAPILAGAAGFFGGTNVASNAAMMPLQAALGRLAGMDPVVLPAVQNGTPFLMVSLQLASIAAGLAGGGATPAQLWRHGWPIAAIALLVGLASVAAG